MTRVKLQFGRTIELQQSDFERWGRNLIKDLNQWDDSALVNPLEEAVCPLRNWLSEELPIGTTFTLSWDGVVTIKVAGESYTAGRISEAALVRMQEEAIRG